MDKKKIGRYTIYDELGRGAMGVVYKGIDEDLERPIAAKMLPKLCFTDESQIERFRQEAKIIAKLDHPNIMKIYSIEYAEDTIWIIMEYLNGRLLSEFIKEKEKFSISKAVEILEQISKALGYAHSKGIVHRDIKPVNVMISENNCVKLMDFGIARDNQSNVHLTRTGTILGTPKYMSPEQFKGKNIDYRTDIYSLGILAYEMLSGEPPFIGKNVMDYAYKHINEEPCPIRKKLPSISSSLETFIHQCLQKEVEKRPISLLKIRFSDFEADTIMVHPPLIKVNKWNRFLKFITLILCILILYSVYLFRNDLNAFYSKYFLKTNAVSDITPIKNIIEMPLQLNEDSKPLHIITEKNNDSSLLLSKDDSPIISDNQNISIETKEVIPKDDNVSETVMQQNPTEIINENVNIQKNDEALDVDDNVKEDLSLQQKEEEPENFIDTSHVNNEVPSIDDNLNNSDVILLKKENEDDLANLKDEDIINKDISLKEESITENTSEINKEESLIIDDDELPDISADVNDEVLPDISEDNFDEEKLIIEEKKEEVLKTSSNTISGNNDPSILNQLNSSDYGEIRIAVINIVKTNNFTNDILLTIKKILTNYIEKPDNSKITVDAIAWCLKAVSKAEDISFLPIIEKLMQLNVHSKIKKYALNTFEELGNTSPLSKNTKILLALRTKDYSLIRGTLKTIIKSKNFDIEILDAIKNIIEQYLSNIENNRVAVDAISLCLITLGRAKNENYIEVIEKVKSQKVHKKILSHASAALKNFS